MELKNETNQNICTNHILCRLKSDNEISFWNRKWIGNQTLKEAFFEAFEGVVDKFGSVANAGFWDDGTWFWKTML